MTCSGGVAAFRIGSAVIARSNIVQAGLDVMRRLIDSSGETVKIIITDGGEVVFLSNVEPPNPIRTFFPPGTRASMQASGAGKVLLAEMAPKVWAAAEIPSLAGGWNPHQP